MKNNWKETTLGEIAVLNYGKGLTAKNRREGSIPVYGSSGITGSHDEYLVDQKSVVIGRKGTVGSLYKVLNPFFPIDTVFYVRENDLSCDFDYFFYLLKTLKLDQLNSDSAVPGLNRENAYAQKINLPSLPEQKALAGVLSSLDDKIELLREQNKILEVTAQTIFKEWFVNFNFPDKNGKPYKDAGGKMIDSEIGEIPDGWRVAKIGDFTKICGGGTPSTKNNNYWNGDIYWTSPKDLSSNFSIFLFDTEKKITNAGLKKISSGLLPKETLLLSSRAPIGYLAITNIEVAINQGYIAFLPDAYFSNHFLFLWLQRNMDLIKNSANGSTFLEISKKAFKNIEVIVPGESVLENFDGKIKPLFEKIKNNSEQIQILSKIRDTLLPKLMSGELKCDYA
jgi:type I restriction enzyme, S subunit